LIYIFLLSSFVFGSILVGLIKTSPLVSFSQDTKIKISTVLPQGWGFFSKDPRENVIQIESIDDAQNVNYPNMTLKNGFGLIRKGRSQAVEIGKITEEIPKDAWKNCANCSRNDMLKSDYYNIKDDSSRPLLKGNYLLTENKVVPWSYAKYYKDKLTPIKYLKVKVK